jgi:hypothetical protein
MSEKICISKVIALHPVVQTSQNLILDPQCVQFVTNFVQSAMQKNGIQKASDQFILHYAFNGLHQFLHIVLGDIVQRILPYDYRVDEFLKT